MFPICVESDQNGTSSRHWMRWRATKIEWMENDVTGKGE